MKKRSRRRFLLAAGIATALAALSTVPALGQMMGGMMGPGGGMCRMMDVTPHPVDPASLPQPNSPGAQILKSKCVQCHGLVSPRQQAAQDWPGIVERMDRRMRMMSGGGMGMMMRANIQPLTPEETNTLVAYLQRNAFKALAPSALPGGGQPGAQAFVRVCSQCHALPDPSTHTPEEWKGVVERMAVNMQNMGYGTLPPAQKKAILVYLKKNARK